MYAMHYMYTYHCTLSSEKQCMPCPIYKHITALSQVIQQWMPCTIYKHITALSQVIQQCMPCTIYKHIAALSQVIQQCMPCTIYIHITALSQVIQQCMPCTVYKHIAALSQVIQQSDHNTMPATIPSYTCTLLAVYCAIYAMPYHALCWQCTLVLNSPLIFQASWAIIRNFLTAKTVNKTLFVSGEEVVMMYAWHSTCMHARFYLFMSGKEMSTYFTHHLALICVDISWCLVAK